MSEPEKPFPQIESDCCKSCGRCVAACPQHCLQISEHYNRYGVKAVAYKGTGCVGCGICFYNCPEPYAIKIVRPDAPAKKPQAPEAKEGGAQ